MTPRPCDCQTIPGNERRWIMRPWDCGGGESRGCRRENSWWDLFSCCLSWFGCPLPVDEIKILVNKSLSLQLEKVFKKYVRDCFL
jgi:hypothetical protein